MAGHRKEKDFSKKIAVLLESPEEPRSSTWGEKEPEWVDMA